LIAVVALSLASGATAQGKKRIEKAADLPVYSYKIDGKLEALIRDDAKFRAFARELRRDTDSVLAQYDIADEAKLRELQGVLVRLDLIEGRYDDALAGALRIRELEESLLTSCCPGCSCARSSRRGARPATRHRTPIGARCRA
jgi:hypothetical protein